MLKFKFILLAVIFACSSSLYAQNAKKYLKNANSMYENKQYKEAIPVFLEVLKLEADNAEANYKIGICYLKSIHKPKALVYLEKAYKVNPAIAPDIKIRLASANHFNHK